MDGHRLLAPSPRRAWELLSEAGFSDGGSLSSMVNPSPSIKFSTTVPPSTASWMASLRFIFTILCCFFQKEKDAKTYSASFNSEHLSLKPVSSSVLSVLNSANHHSLAVPTMQISPGWCGLVHWNRFVFLNGLMVIYAGHNGAWHFHMIVHSKLGDVITIVIKFLWRWIGKKISECFLFAYGIY